MITEATIYTAMYAAMKRAVIELPPDVLAALQRALEEETEPLAREHLNAVLENARLAGEGKGLVCGDTGFPLFFVRVGAATELEGGVPSIRRAAEQATERLTAEGFLRPTMVDPLDRSNPGNNLGPGMPKIETMFDEALQGLDIVAAPKGGGSEIFGTFYRMLFPSDGMEGIKKFVIECVKDSCYAGKICPPAILGVGIGGTADLCMKLAKEAAVLRPIGSVHERADVALLEGELLAACRKLGIGPMGSRGINCVIGLHIACAVTHTAALPVAVNAQCLIGRRWRAKVMSEGEYHLTGDMDNWNPGTHS